jgi:hypothetical protein
MPIDHPARGCHLLLLFAVQSLSFLVTVLGKWRDVEPLRCVIYRTISILPWGSEKAVEIHLWKRPMVARTFLGSVMLSLTPRNPSLKVTWSAKR